MSVAPFFYPQAAKAAGLGISGRGLNAGYGTKGGGKVLTGRLTASGASARM
jgi:hypothetical protein